MSPRVVQVVVLSWGLLVEWSEVAAAAAAAEELYISLLESLES